MSAVVFCGVSISFEEARSHLDAVMLPPVKRGDIPRLLRGGERPEYIGIVDGMFYQRAAVGHREILDAMRMGIKVYGAASMGALRASELHPYGMRGVGRIFRCYVEGSIESDEEVALVFDPESCTPLSVPHVNVRYALKAALGEGLIDEAQRRELLALSASIYYPERTYELLIRRGVEEGVINVEDEHRLVEFLSQPRLDLKRLDAIEMLKRMRRDMGVMR